MELEIYEALTAVNVPADKARAAAESIDRAIDKRYSLHREQLSTKGDLKEAEANLRRDLAEIKTELIKWIVGTIFGAAAFITILSKFLQ